MEWLNLEHIVTDKSIAHLEGIEWVRLKDYQTSKVTCDHYTYHTFEKIRIKPLHIH